MTPAIVIVLTSLLLQSAVAMVVATVLTWLGRTQAIPQLRWVSISWWWLAAHTSAAAVAYDVARRDPASALWTAAAFAALVSVVMHAAFLMVGVRLIVHGKAPTRPVLWAAAAAALAFAAAGLWLPAAGRAGTDAGEFIRDALPSLVLAGTYAALMPGLWRHSSPGEFGNRLLVAALGANAAIAGSHGLVSLAGALHLQGTPSAVPWFPISVVGQALFGLGWTGVLLELEQRRRHEAAQRAIRADRMLHEALNASDDLIGVVDQSERLVLCNARMAATIKEVTGVTVTPFMPYPRPGRTPEERAAFFSTITRALAGERVHERNEVFSVSTGRRVLLDRHIVPIREDGAVTGAFVVARDVTDDEALRTEAERAMRIEAMARMAGGLAHDFNNILTVVQTNLQLLAESGDHDTESMDIIMETAGALDRANQLTRRLLGVARDRPASPARVDVAVLVRDFSRFLQHAVGEEVVLAFDVPSVEAPVLIDPGRLEQVLLNLSLNARDAMPQGGTLRISVRRRKTDAAAGDAHALAAHGDVVVTVADEGTGMDDATLLRAGDPFFTTKPSAVGSGLGLATCRALVSEAGGALQIDSRLGHGTTVTIVLPAAG